MENNSNQYKIRSRQTALELRDNRRLTFYAALYDVETAIRDYAPPYKQRMLYREVVRPTAFDSSLQGNGEVLGTIMHEGSRSFSKRSTGELLLQSDSKGLFATCELPKTAIGDEVLRGLETGKFRGASFGFYPINEQWTDGKLPLCELVDVNLADVSIVDDPAYPTDVHIRSSCLDFFRRLRLLKLK
jgi:HK97 family phage prohead protease